MGKTGLVGKSEPTCQPGEGHGKGKKRTPIGKERGSMKKYVCVHGHFYQPPRENPWLEAVELQDSARPYHDWNERSHGGMLRAQRPFARPGRQRTHRSASSIIIRRISFNFGPTLLSWMQRASAGHPRGHCGRGQRKPAALFRPWFRPRAMLQPCHHAAGQRAGQTDPGGLGSARFRDPVWAGRRKACGCQNARRTWNRSRH